MVRYFSSWTPLVIVGAVVILTLPWLGLIALTVVSLVAVAALAAVAWAIVSLPLLLGRAISRQWHSRVGASPRTAALPAATSRFQRARSVPASATALVANHLPKRDM